VTPAGLRSVPAPGAGRQAPDGDLVMAALDEIISRADMAAAGPWTLAEQHGRDIAAEAWSREAVTGADGDPVALTYETSVLEPDCDGNGPFIAAARDDVPFLAGALRDILELAAGARPAGTVSVGCTGSCHGGACDCTATVVAWNLDPEAVRAVVAARLAGRPGRAE
jgi:hypothetical protein